VPAIFKDCIVRIWAFHIQELYREKVSLSYSMTVPLEYSLPYSRSLPRECQPAIFKKCKGRMCACHIQGLYSEKVCLHIQGLYLRMCACHIQGLYREILPFNIQFSGMYLKNISLSYSRTVSLECVPAIFKD
jgi:hypothetical protein